eukprot:TRINITY_DN2230_c0_g1_i1.p1 TRINITY_DN2230_c0_g1~~TRINITY_DN2230_c0_g1_i1.p1  ORF type:complete len:512 (+),score=98.40 TRINITY_DN2230_c0_g1_i1:17-1552(+)
MKFFTLFIILLVLIKNSTPHTTQICYRVDSCTGELFLALGTYHTVSGSAQGNITLTSNSGLIPQISIPLNSLAAANPMDSDTNTPPSGFDQSECEACQSGPYYGQNLNTHALANFKNLPADTYTVGESGTDINFDQTGSGPGCIPSNIQIGSPSTSFINCPSDIVVNVDDSCTGTITVSDPTCFVDTNICPTTTCSVDPDSGNVYTNVPIGTYTNRWEILVNGGIRTGIMCSHTISVEDNSLPSIVCPDDISTVNPEVTVPLPTIGDNCGVQSYSNNYTNTQDASDTYPEGITTVEYTVEDIYGNTDTCSFNVEILELCRNNIIVELEQVNSFNYTVVPEDVLLDFSGSNINFITDVTFDFGDFISQEMDGTAYEVTIEAQYDGQMVNCTTDVILSSGQPDLKACTNNFIHLPLIFSDEPMYRPFTFSWLSNIGLDEDKYELTIGVYSEDQSVHYYDVDSGIKANSGSYYWIGFHQLIPFLNYQIAVTVTDTSTNISYGPFCSTILYLTIH